MSAPAVSVTVKKAACRSDLGKLRKANEDGFLCLNKVPLFAVADGTNGPEAPRVALTALKDTAPEVQARVGTVATDGSTASRLAIGRTLVGLFAKANQLVQEAGEAISDRRIATTLAAATVAGPSAFVAHVGDSRVYLMRGGELRLITNDHTLAALQLRRGDISAEEFHTSPFRRTLSQALGMNVALDVDTAELRLLPGDVLLITTNGLTRALDDDQIARVLMSDADPEAMADKLLSKVHENGAPDNTTFIIVATEGAGTGGKPRGRVTDLEPTVRKSFLYRGLSTTEWLQVAPYLEQLEARPGEVICRAGGATIGFAVVADGKVRVNQQGGEVKDLSPGEHFGGLSLASDQPGLDTATAVDTVVLYVLTRARFNELVRVNPTLGGKLTLALLETLGNRLGVLTTRLAAVIEAVQGRL
ncbi:MAG: cyclic nucleotide-binding domain-containing protein [Deltaproteobacteria bacterium]|nr:cyclic nucleotide-binding domain-containing protein [Deltaproteobacteria bacterium]